MSTFLDVQPVAPAPEAAPPQPARRRRRWRWVTAAVLPLALFAGVYILFFTPDSPAPLTLSEPARSRDHTALGVPVGRWSVGSGSVAGYRVREKLLRLPAPNDAVGRTNAVVGDLILDADGRGLVVKSGMRVDVDVASLTSDEPRRDDHMRTMAIETDRFPTASFVSTADLVVPANMVSAGPVKAAVQGDLTIHGVTRPVSIPLEAQRTGDRIEVVGSFVFGWDLFGMKQPNLSYVTVESDPTLELQLFFDHESAATLNGLGSDDS